MKPSLTSRTSKQKLNYPSIQGNTKSSLVELIQSLSQQFQFMFQYSFSNVDHHLENPISPKSSSRVVNSFDFGNVFETASKQTHTKLIAIDLEINRLLYALQKAWLDHQISPSHRFYFLKRIQIHPITLPSMLNHQLQLIYKKQHIWYSVRRIIQAREKCLIDLQESVAKMQSADINQHFHIVQSRKQRDVQKQEKRNYQISGYPAKLHIDTFQNNFEVTKFQVLTENLQRYLKITMATVELISKWKEYLYSLGKFTFHSIRPAFYYQNKNYVLKMLNDNHFLMTSFLANFYSFSPCNDPFLIKPWTTLMHSKSDNQRNDLTHDQKFLLRKAIQIDEFDLKSFKIAIGQFYQELKYPSFQLTQIKDNLLSKRFPTWESRLSDDQNQKLSANQKVFKSLKKQSNQSIKSIEKYQIKSKKSLTQISSSPNSLKILHLPGKSIIQKLSQEIQQKIKISDSKNIFRVNLNGKSGQNKMILSEGQKWWLGEEINVELKCVSMSWEELKILISKIYKSSNAKTSHQILVSEEELKEELESCNYCYILEAETAQMEAIAHCFVIGQTDILPRTVKMHIFTCRPLNLLGIVNRCINFVHKYDPNITCISLVFRSNLSESSTNQTIFQSLQQHLKCHVTQNIVNTCRERKFQIRFPNNESQRHQSKHLGIRLYALVSLRELQLGNRMENEVTDGKDIDYVYMLMKMRDNMMSNEDLYLIGSEWKEKMKEMIYMIEEQSKKDEEKIIISDNVDELNQKLAILKMPSIHLHDLVKINLLQLIHWQLQFVFPFPHKLASLNHTNYHILFIHSNLQVYSTHHGLHYCLPFHNKHQYKLMIFNLRQSGITKNKDLREYCRQIIKSSKAQEVKVRHLYIPMLEPSNQSSVNMYEVDDLTAIHKKMYVGRFTNWSHSVPLQNAIKFTPETCMNDVILDFPLGIAILKEHTILYCQIIA